jgi:hypothetical protein
MFSDEDMKVAYGTAVDDDALPQSSVEERQRAASSAAAAGHKRRIKRKAQPAAAAAAAAAAVDHDMADAGFKAPEAVDLPVFRVESMRNFLQQFPHVSLNTECELATAKLDVAKATLSKTAASKMRKSASAAAPGVESDIVVLTDERKDLSVVKSRRLQFDQSQHEPCEVELLRDARAKLIMPDYTHELTMRSHKESCDLLRRKRLRIPLHTAAHESALMGQHSGSWETEGLGWRTFPPCCYGTQCIGFSSPGLIAGLTERVIFMRAMSPDEWTQLITTGAQPPGTGPCVLDGRLHTTRYACKARMGLRPNHTLQSEEPEAVYQLWRNLMNEPGGYYDHYVFIPHENEILIDPIVAFHSSPLSATRLPNGMWRVNQEAMVWKKPVLLPRNLGESVQNFCAGADSTSKPMPSSSHAETASKSPCPPPTAVCSA